MAVIGVTGTTGKTTVSWLIRSILEQHGKTMGMMSDTEHSVNADYLDLDGNIWKSDEVDVAKVRDTASPYHIAPYTGRYKVDETLPNPLQVLVLSLLVFWILFPYLHTRQKLKRVACIFF